jgi:hypothetical protein
MYRLACLITSLFFASVASATYTNVSPPMGYANIGGSAQFLSTRAVGSYSGGLIANAGLNVGGKSLAVRTALPFVGGAAAAAARAMFLNPALAAVAVAAVWASENCVGVVNGEWKITCGPGTGTQSTGFNYRLSGSSYTTSWGPDKAAVCAEWGALLGGVSGYSLVSASLTGAGQNTCSVVRQATSTGTQQAHATGFQTQPNGCQSGYYVGPAGCTQSPQTLPISQSEFESRLGASTMPATLPAAVPANYPVGVPILNVAGDNSTAQKLIVPTGSPTVVPNSNPVSYIQPSTEVTPANSTSNPWQVDVKPISVPVSTPTGNTNPQSIPTTSSGGGGADNPDFCQQHPQSHVCTEMGNLEAETLPNENINLQVTPDSGWSIAPATCPNPHVETVAYGVQLEFSYQPMCDFATGVRGVVIALAWLSAAYILLGLRSGDDA